MLKQVRMILIALAAGAGVSGCVYDDYGYGGASVGYGPGYYGDYYSGGYGAYGSPYWGWYGDYYYPGTGYYVYDRNRRAHRWDDRQRNYWQGRRGQWRGDRGNGPRWDGWNRPGGDRPGFGGRPGGNRPGFDPRPGFQNVPRGSSQSPYFGRRPGDRPRATQDDGNHRPDFRRPDSTPGVGQGVRRPDRGPPGAGRGGYRRPDGGGGRGPRGGRRGG